MNARSNGKERRRRREGGEEREREEGRSDAARGHDTQSPLPNLFVYSVRCVVCLTAFVHCAEAQRGDALGEQQTVATKETLANHRQLDVRSTTRQGEGQSKQ